MNDEQRANELYWNSTQSVNSIASELGLSKGRLYGAVRPLPAGRTCPSCGSGLIYENRTARERGTAVCLSCDGEATPDAMPGADDGTSRDVEMGVWAPDPGTARILMGAAIGGAVGLILVRWLRR